MYQLGHAKLQCTAAEKCAKCLQCHNTVHHEDFHLPVGFFRNMETSMGSIPGT